MRFALFAGLLLTAFIAVDAGVPRTDGTPESNRKALCTFSFHPPEKLFDEETFLGKPQERLVHDTSGRVYLAAKNYNKWFDKLEMERDGVEMTWNKTAGYHVVATRDLQVGEKVILVKNERILEANNYVWSDIKPALDEYALDLPVEARLAILILFEKYVNQTSLMGPIIDTLPNWFEMPPFLGPTDRAFFTPKELALAEGTDAALHKLHHDYFVPLSNMYPEICPREHFTPSNLKWAIGVAWDHGSYFWYHFRRSFGIFPMSHSILMGPEPNVEIMHDNNKAVGEVTVLSPIAAGETLIGSYGKIGNRGLLSTHGVVYENNPNDKLLLKLDFGASSDKYYPEKMKALETYYRLTPGKKLQWYIHPKDMDEKTLFSMRVISMTGSEFYNDQWMAAKEGKPISAESEARMWGMIRDTLKSQLVEDYDGTLEEHEATLARSDLTDRQRMIVYARVSEMRLIQSKIDEAQAHVDAGPSFEAIEAPAVAENANPTPGGRRVADAKEEIEDREL